MGIGWGPAALPQVRGARRPKKQKGFGVKPQALFLYANRGCAPCPCWFLTGRTRQTNMQGWGRLACPVPQGGQKARRLKMPLPSVPTV